MVVTEFEKVRPRLFGIAHRIVGRAPDAEDVVQDAWVRWQTADRSVVRCPIAFLSTTTRRLALNVVASARVRREVSTGDGLPRADLAAVDPARQVESGEAVAAAIHLLMERLCPVERAVYVLRETFDYPFREIAGVLQLSEANARQLAHRARWRLREERHRPVDPAERDRLLGAFLDAARTGDLARLVDVLSRQRIMGRGEAPSMYEMEGASAPAAA